MDRLIVRNVFLERFGICDDAFFHIIQADFAEIVGEGLHILWHGKQFELDGVRLGLENVDAVQSVILLKPSHQAFCRNVLSPQPGDLQNVDL